MKLEPGRRRAGRNTCVPAAVLPSCVSPAAYESPPRLGLTLPSTNSRSGPRTGIPARGLHAMPGHEFLVRTTDRDPGAWFTRDAGRRLTTHFPLAVRQRLLFSNRNTQLLESGLTHRKETIETRSNLNISRVGPGAPSSVCEGGVFEVSRLRSHPTPRFLLDNGCRVELGVTSTRQWNEGVSVGTLLPIGLGGKP
jgi:hypothetical protein